MGIIVGIIALLMLAVLALVFGIWLLLHLIPLFFFCLFIFALVFWIWMLVDCIKNLNISGNERVIWVIVMLLTYCLGALVYFIAARSRPPRWGARPMA